MTRHHFHAKTSEKIPTHTGMFVQNRGPFLASGSAVTKGSLTSAPGVSRGCSGIPSVPGWGAGRERAGLLHVTISQSTSVLLPSHLRRDSYISWLVR